jgi:hypothetical protein
MRISAEILKKRDLGSATSAGVVKGELTRSFLLVMLNSETGN